MPKTNQPIKAIEYDLITMLEFIRVSMKLFPRQTDRVLTVMDLSDEAFKEAYVAVASVIDFEDSGEDDGGDS